MSVLLPCRPPRVSRPQLEEGKKLVRDAIAAGIFNDLGSGTNVDLCVITKDGAQMLRPYDVANVKGARYVSSLRLCYPFSDFLS